jgi:hypothetical protein
MLLIISTLIYQSFTYPCTITHTHTYICVATAMDANAKAAATKRLKFSAFMPGKLKDSRSAKVRVEMHGKPALQSVADGFKRSCGYIVAEVCSSCMRCVYVQSSVHIRVRIECKHTHTHTHTYLFFLHTDQEQSERGEADESQRRSAGCE